MVYVALLRGINVGGNNKIDMKELKKTFERVGMNNVKTYINTGNIIYTHQTMTKGEMVSLLEEAIHADFGLHIRVVVRSLNEFRNVIDALPDTWVNDQTMKCDVLFLWDEVNDESVMEQLPLKPEIDRVVYAPGAVIWSSDRENVTKSGLSKIIGTKLYKLITVRNVNTTRKIYELMQAAEQTSTDH
ncbi:DUF1697 domain-containing protein [Paenibacillus sp. J5C_2022]|uniref:DUF1697 domain-containing protein n=1 Tax=Paenibacillus sp. J5C2022 TaxID=2977129 RepID=UPI0021D16C11|nr:DUF1697 domain-containing protein [Paenibacillus sp. J5C2022]MCU6712107.1 DUF1697 domain-containing protein [Paenibacillus sp. J5C2022]